MIRQEARNFIVQSSLLASHKNDPGINRLVIGVFLQAWHDQEQEPQP